LVVDIGGGSTELVFGSDHVDASVSLNMGALRMTERYLRSSRPSQAELDACSNEVRRLLVEAKSTLPLQRVRTVIGVAGTVIALSCINANLRSYGFGCVHGMRLSAVTVRWLLHRLLALDLHGRRLVLIDPKRAEVIVAGALVLVTTMEELGVGEIVVSECDLLDAVAASAV
jgi:exopolyphosphatase/guanosine-5'-triphosphate,3'-diphosphate pyrophosphatase